MYNHEIQPKEILEIELINPSQLESIRQGAIAFEDSGVTRRPGALITDPRELEFRVIVGWDQCTSPPTPIYAKGITIWAICERMEFLEPRDLHMKKRAVENRYIHMPSLPKHVWIPRIEDLPARLFWLRLCIKRIKGEVQGGHEEDILAVTIDPTTGRSYYFHCD